MASGIRVCVLAKPPVPGAAKTRLALLIGRRRAALLARAFLEDTLAAVAQLPWATPICAATGPLGFELPGGFELVDQGGGDLGARMERALQPAPAIVLGSDSAGLPRAHLEEARAALERGEAVIGPAADGGFTLLGLPRLGLAAQTGSVTALLAGLPWSANDSCARTVHRLRERGLAVHLLPRWFDVDEAGDLAALRAAIAADAIPADATRRALSLPWLSVIVPVLNEEARIGERLRELQALPLPPEIIVVDGASSDRTVEIAEGFAEGAQRSKSGANSVRVLRAPRGRASQLNAGAAVASGEVLLFLHADTQLPPDALAHLDDTLEDPAVVAGAFRTWTVDDLGSSWLGPLLHLADLRSRYSRLPYGDQALFVRRSAFDSAGGFPEQELMEDLELSRKLSRLGRIHIANATVRVSGRRFLAKPLRMTLFVNVFPLLYRLGVSPRTLRRLYDDFR